MNRYFPLCEKRKNPISFQFIYCKTKMGFGDEKSKLRNYEIRTSVEMIDFEKQVWNSKEELWIDDKSLLLDLIKKLEEIDIWYAASLKKYFEERKKIGNVESFSIKNYFIERNKDERRIIISGFNVQSFVSEFNFTGTKFENNSCFIQFDLESDFLLSWEKLLSKHIS